MDKSRIRILIACEFSGIVRDAFIAEGFNAISCDLLPSERPGPHYQGDIRDLLVQDWDMMIAHPPCTYLSYAGIGYFNEEKYGDKAIKRKASRLEAVEFFMLLWNAPIPKICIENPVGFMNKVFRKPDQIIHPYFFGDPHKKRTCLWLKNLPPLYHSTITDLFYLSQELPEPDPLCISVRKPGKLYKGGEIKKRYFADAKQFVNGEKIESAHSRSKTFPGIATAMASQWGNCLLTL